MKSLAFAIGRVLSSFPACIPVELRQITRVIVILTVGAWLLKADGVPPSLVWTGDATTLLVYGPTGGSGGDLPDGLESEIGCGDDIGGCFGTFTNSRTFSVVSPGVFSFTTDAYSSGSFFNGAGGPIYGGALVYVNFSDTDSIIGPTSFSQGVSDSGSNSQDCSEAPYGVCDASVTLSDSANNFVFLPIGDYTLEQSYSFFDYGSGDLAFGNYLSVTTTLVPTPEPRFGIVLLAIGFLGLCGTGFMHRSRSKSRK